MIEYEKQAIYELRKWQKEMSRKPSIMNRLAKGIQTKGNNLIPEKVHIVITETIKNMIKAVLVGSKYITKEPLKIASLEEREKLVNEKLSFYKKTASVSGAGTGAGGILLGLADFPILLSLKMKFLFDVASIYGFDVKDYKERIYIIHIFELAFSSQKKRVEVYSQMLDWDNYSKNFPEDINLFDWREFQQEYRDYIDLAKMLQLLPGIGSVVGAYANYQLMDKLGEIAINSYRLRIFNEYK
ncbi:hypothetical protein Curi_c11210 [Gottschalkia acidurici 9a]|uniref:EcsC family protein n=1 Tax=Gottschalkia acidurici (strain ATCC 7906 / DSM 604 / BCRC 14475 / CIP 104303 / KCTC 5404 / NCIMB 10678 / 9a) TaxID=1128398 RepID=K0AZJ3_GOTA9|nr:EcsC family protein [Gottschalkia acidurici]AFS78135.1 hypothetical protein Curi_c11210 [Gottschalkia acidurici 9a]